MDRIAEELSDARAAVLQWASKDSAATKAVAQVFDKLRLALQATGNLTAGADSRATLKAQALWVQKSPTPPRELEPRPRHRHRLGPIAQNDTARDGSRPRSGKPT